MSQGTRPNDTKPTEIGTVLVQRYEVLRELGRGGMGVVYLCRDLVTGDRVALKRLRTPEDAKEVRSEESWWFQQEARAVASLEHPTIVRARDFGQLGDGSPYLVMDVLPGRSVHEWMHTTTMPFSVIWALVDQVLAGLAHVHARGVIHGDLKPSNVMLDLASPRGPRAYILDLGLAWLRSPRHDPRLDKGPAPEASVHSGAGTVGWVAPEQIRKAATLVGPPTDLYALGCIAYRVLTGKEVFEGNAQEVLRAHKRTPPPPLALRADAPPQAADFVLRLLAKKPWDRFEFAADARRAWAALRPEETPSLEEVVAKTPPHASLPAPQSSRPALGHAMAVGRSLAPGLLALRLAPMVGREHEREALWRVVRDVALAPPGERRFVALIGEAGVGKSRLAEWLCEQVHEHGRMVPLRARYGRISSPLDGLTGAINAHFGFEGADRALIEQTLMQRWEVDPRDDAALTWVAATAEWLRPSPPGAQVPLGPTGKRFVLDTPEIRFAVMHRVLERIGRDRPVLIWFDDLHLASPNTFETLARLRRASPHLRLLCIATARSETLATDLDAALRLEAVRADWNGQVMELAPMDAEETQALLKATLPLHEDAVAHATSQSRGNPLFALQLLYAWSGGGYLKLDQGQYVVPEEALRGRAITTSELWDERLRAVPTDLRLAAYAAAALGDDIRGDVLKALVSSLGMNARDAMVALTRAQILIASGNDQFRWPHALLLEHLLERLQERNDAPAIYRLASAALAKHPAVGSRRIMKHRVANLLKAGDDEPAARLMFDFIEGSWRRGRDTAATLRDLSLLEGRVSGSAAAEYAYWKAEALRHTGRLEEAKEQAELAFEAFTKGQDRRRAAHALRLLGHIGSDLGAPAQARQKVVEAIQRFQALGDEAGRAQSEVVLGEIDYLLGDHARARAVLRDASHRCSLVGDALGRAQCLLLQAMVSNAVGAWRHARDLVLEARAEFDGIGYRLGVAQSDAILGHSDHRAFDFPRARTRALAARASFRDLTNPRGEAGCERLLAMVSLDEGDLEAAEAHAHVAMRIYDRLQDPWGELESRLLLTQVALCRDDERAASMLAECTAIVVDEAEPRQHRHLTAAWLAHVEGRWADAAEEIDRARAAFGDGARTGDHTPQLLARFARMHWVGPAAAKIEAWVQTLERLSADLPMSATWPTATS
jgi:tRNA A-37 threonylcarbamoyl transferase component Bud32/tetratricopeptide (TPR) repeat protein